MVRYGATIASARMAISIKRTRCACEAAGSIVVDQLHDSRLVVDQDERRIVRGESRFVYLLDA